MHLLEAASGIRVFRYTHIPSSANWDMGVEQALDECERMVLLLSPSSMPQRKEVHREWFYFDQVGKGWAHPRLSPYGPQDFHQSKLWPPCRERGWFRKKACIPVPIH